jgi:acyl carrier protein
LDIARLPEPGITAKGDGVKPRNETEGKLAEIWSEILGVEKDVIGIDSDFFESGGHSLRATVLVSRIHKELGVKVLLTDIFMAPTIRGISDLIRVVKNRQEAAVDEREEREQIVI